MWKSFKGRTNKSRNSPDIFVSLTITKVQNCTQIQFKWGKKRALFKLYRFPSGCYRNKKTDKNYQLNENINRDFDSSKTNGTQNNIDSGIIAIYTYILKLIYFSRYRYNSGINIFFDKLKTFRFSISKFEGIVGKDICVQRSIIKDFIQT